MQSQFEKIWCLEYDEDSYYHPLTKVNFEKYLSCILSNQYFGAFQIEINKQLNNTKQWNQRCWAMLQFFNFLNEIFQLEKFEENVQFVSNIKMRKSFGMLRMWIDLQRLYMSSFLKLDKIEFQQDRIFFVIYRTLLFHRDFLVQHDISCFNNEYIKSIENGMRKHTSILLKYLPKYMTPFLVQLQNIITNFITKKQLVNHKAIEEMKKMAYLKLTREYQMMVEIEIRLTNQIDFLKKQGQIKQVQKIAASKIIHKVNEQVRDVYDPKYRIINQFKKKAEKNHEEIDQNRLNELLQQYRQKNKSKPVDETPYQGLTRVGHNPYDNSNYVIYGQQTGIDMNKKKQMEQKDQKKEEIEYFTEDQYKYPKQYIQQSLLLTKDSSRVLYSDLRTQAVANQKENRNNYIGGSGKLSNTIWQKFMGVPEPERHKVLNMAALDNIQTINKQKNLELNTIFPRANELEDQQKEKRDQIIKKIFMKDIKSQTLFQTQKKCQSIYKTLQLNEFNPQLLFSIRSKSTIDRNKFDSLRKAIHVSAVKNKIKRWINEQTVPNFYPRGIQQIKQYNCKMMETAEKRNRALNFTLQEE